MHVGRYTGLASVRFGHTVLRCAAVVLGQLATAASVWWPHPGRTWPHPGLSISNLLLLLLPLPGNCSLLASRQDSSDLPEPRNSNMIANAASVGLARGLLRPKQQPHIVHRRQAVAVASNRAPADSSAATELSGNTSRQQSNGKQPEPNVECVATGMDVQCYISDDEGSRPPSSQQQPQQAPALATSMNGNGQGQHIDCVATGMDVQCFISDDGEPASSAAAVQGSPAAPKTAAAAAASGEGGPLMQLLGAALLVSPFFFWGTSMVAMKVRG